MRTEDHLKKGRVEAFQTSKHHPVTASAVKAVGEEDSKALIIDGSTNIDPYWMVKVCKAEGFEEREVLKKIMINRAFTAYQMESIVDKTGDMIKREPNITFLGLIAFSGRFIDEDIPEEEGRCLRTRCVEKISEMVKRYDLQLVVADEYPEVFMRRIEVDIDGKERAYVPSKA